MLHLAASWPKESKVPYYFRVISLSGDFLNFHFFCSESKKKPSS